MSGVRCTACRYPTTEPVARCPVCGGATEAAAFGPGGTVFSATVLRVPVPGRTPPYGLAYVDLDDGPRILAHVLGHDEGPLAPNDPVELSGTTAEGDPAGGGGTRDITVGCLGRRHLAVRQAAGGRPGRTSPRQAVLEALDDAGVDGVDAVLPAPFRCAGTIQRALQTVGIVEVPIVSIENACATGTSAFHEARVNVESGRYEQVLALGVETMTLHFGGAIHPEATDREGRQGMALPSVYAMSATSYVHEFGVTARAARLGLGEEPPPRHRQPASPAPAGRDRRRRARLPDDRRPADPAAVLLDRRRRGRRRRRSCPRRRAGRARPVERAAVGEVVGPPSSRVWGWDIVHDTAATPTSRPASSPVTSTCSRCTTRSPSARS